MADDRSDNRSWLGRIASVILLVTGGLAAFWLVVLRIVAKVHAGERCPFALAGMADNPIRRKHMGRMLDRAGSRPGERVLGWDLAARWLRWTSSHL